MVTLVQAGGHNRRPCPFSGRYSLSGSLAALSGLMDVAWATDGIRGSTTASAPLTAVMHAGCSQHSSDLNIEATLQVPADGSADPDLGPKDQGPKRAPRPVVPSVQVKSDFICHGTWPLLGGDLRGEVQGSRSSYLASPTRRRTYELYSNYVDYFGGSESSSSSFRSRGLSSTSGFGRVVPGAPVAPVVGRSEVIVLSRHGWASDPYQGPLQSYLCLVYSETEDGTLLARADPYACDDPGVRAQIGQSLRMQQDQSGPENHMFNISSSGPCLQALTGGAGAPLKVEGRSWSLWIVSLALTVVFHQMYLSEPAGRPRERLR